MSEKNFFYNPQIREVATCQFFEIPKKRQFIGANLISINKYHVEVIKALINVGNKVYINPGSGVTEAGYFHKENSFYVFELEFFCHLVKPVLEKLGFRMTQIDDPEYLIFRNNF